MSDTYTVTLEIDVESEEIEKQIQTDLTDLKGNKMTGTAEVDLEDILEETITGIKLVESTAPEPVPMAVEWAVCSPIWRDNLKNITHDGDEEMVPLENKE